MNRKDAEEKRVAIITGGCRGIGLGIAEALAEEGFALCLNGVRPREAVADVLAGFEDRTDVLYVSADVSTASGRADLMDGCRRRFGRLDMMVNNAGVAPKVRADLLEGTEESFDWVVGINLKGPYFLCQLAGQWLVEERRKAPDRPLAIINIGSISSETVSVNRGEYCVAKAALTMVTRLFAARLADENINVLEISPGIIETDMTAGVKAKYDKLIGDGLTPIRRWGVPADIGKAVAAVARGLLPFSTGAVIPVDGGFHLKTL